ncbi:MAG: hypothetical protein MRY78_04345 [Saprospiraceae bacterium]|nr:hypothetical protein [Saprospiraceae bacterium]
MPSKKLITLLHTFTKADLTHFNKFLYSPYFNENGEILQLFELIDQDLRQQAVKPLNIMDKEAVWKRLFGQKKFNDAYIRKLCYELGQHASHFLLLEGQKSKKLESDLTLLDIFSCRKLFKHFDSLSRKLYQSFQSPIAIDYYGHYQLELLNHTKLEKAVGKFKTLDHLEKADHFLDCFFIVKKLKLFCDFLDYKHTVSKEPKIGMIPGFLDYVQRSEFMQHPLIKAYYLVTRMLLEKEQEAYFQELKQTLLDHAKNISGPELKTLYIYLINYCIDTKINAGHSEYFHELFDLYKAVLDEELFIEKNTISPQDYKNIITVGLHVRAFEWVEHFIQTYTHKLPEEHQENALTYNLAKVYFHKEDYPKVIEQLREVEYKNLVYALGGKLMLLKTYYELDEYIALDSLIDSFRIYLRRNRKISKEVKQQYMNVLRFVKKLSNLDPYDKEAIVKVRNQVEACKALASKKWILQKIEVLQK